MRDFVFLNNLGEILDECGNPVKISRACWKHFVTKLDDDIKAWRHYNAHVHELAEQIISYFIEKRVECCEICDNGNMTMSQLGVKRLCDQLFEAMETTQYWRYWLHNMVNEAHSLTGLADEIGKV